MILNLILLYVGSYLFGAVPYGVLIARSKGIDLLSVGSGNIGATNVRRALGAKWAWVVFATDVLKGAIPSFAARFVVTHEMHGVPAQAFWMAAGLAAVFGHCVSPFLKFKGGKGVSTALGMVAGAAPLVAACCATLFVTLLLVTQYMSIASLAGVYMSGVFGWFLPGQARELLPLYLLLVGFVTHRHRKNIARLLNGTEPKFSIGRDSNDATKSTETAPPDPNAEHSADPSTSS